MISVILYVKTGLTFVDKKDESEEGSMKLLSYPSLD